MIPPVQNFLGEGIEHGGRISPNGSKGIWPPIVIGGEGGGER